MCYKLFMRRLVPLLVCLIFCAARPARTQVQSTAVYAGAGPQKAIWILGNDGRLSAFDSSSFRLRMTTGVPPDTPKDPEKLSISPLGMVIFAGTGPETHLLHLWSSNRYAPELTGGVEEKLPSEGGGGTKVTFATPVVYFTADGQRLFWFENRMTETQRGENVSRTGRFLSWTTNLQGGDLRKVLSFDLARCACETGACEESCPQMSAWAPASGVSDFFFLTRWIPGQTESETLETNLYQRTNGGWAPKKLPVPVDSFLDAADRGETYVDAVPDAGCCGWINESDDVTFVSHGGQIAKLFNERSRFHNDDYDVSFFTSNARLSPDVTQIAYTVESTRTAGQEIRLSSEGKSNPDELRAIQAALPDLPRVEVVPIADLSKPRFSLADSELVGWMDTKRLLAFQRGELIIVDAATGQSSPTGL